MFSNDLFLPHAAEPGVWPARSAALTYRLHLIRFHGVLAPHAKLWPLVVPQGPEVQEQATEVAVAEGCEVKAVQARPHGISWARLLKRVFDIDMQHCPNCGAGGLEIIAALLERPAIEKILTRLGLDPQRPPRGRAREAVTLPPENVPLAECFNTSKEYGIDEDSAGALHAGVQAGSCAAGDRRAEHCGGGQIAGRGGADAVQLGQG